MRIGLAQMDIIWEDVEGNQRKAEHFFKEAAGRKADLLVFPEMTLTGFSMHVEKTAANWEDQLGFFMEMTKKYSTAAICGYPAPADQEACPAGTGSPGMTSSFGKAGSCRKTGSCRNHLALVRDGEVLMDYEKIHPFSYGQESGFFSGGDRIVGTDFEGTGLGAFICYDLRFPEIFQISSEKNEIICLIANWPAARISHWDILLQARAIENQCFMVGVNRTGSGGGLDYNGHSAVYGPGGDRMNDLSRDEGLIMVEIDPREAGSFRNTFPVKKDRRKELYRSLSDDRSSFK